MGGAEQPEQKEEKKEKKEEEVSSREASGLPAVPLPALPEAAAPAEAVDPEDEEEARRRRDEEREDERRQKEATLKAEEAAEAKDNLLRAAHAGDIAELRRFLPDRPSQTLHVEGSLSMSGAPRIQPVLPPGVHEALYTAAGQGHWSIVDLLITTGVGANVAVHGEGGAMSGATPLHAAAIGGFVDIGLTLLNADADVNAATKGGLRPLHIAAGCRGAARPDMVKLLIDNGADAGAKDADGRTASKVALGLYVAYDGKGSEATAAVASMEHLRSAGWRDGAGRSVGSGRSRIWRGDLTASHQGQGHRASPMPTAHRGQTRKEARNEQRHICVWVALACNSHHDVLPALVSEDTPYSARHHTYDHHDIIHIHDTHRMQGRQPAVRTAMHRQAAAPAAHNRGAPPTRVSFPVCRQ